MARPGHEGAETAIIVGSPTATITVGAGLDKPRGRRVAVDGGVAGLARVLADLPPELEAWWAPHTWRRDARNAATWEGSCAVVLDVDRDGHAVLPAKLAARLDEAVREGGLPGSVFHRTPAGARVVFAFDAPCSNPAAFERAAKGAAFAVAANLAELSLDGLAVDPKPHKDRARIYFTPNSIAKGVQRRAEVVVMRHQPYTVDELAELAPEAEPRPSRPTPVAPLRPLASAGHDLELAREALLRLDPDAPYGEWLAAGMALHARFPDGDGLALWDEWSSRGQKYQGRREIETKWATFKPGGGVGFGSLVHMAGLNGSARVPCAEAAAAPAVDARRVSTSGRPRADPAGAEDGRAAQSEPGENAPPELARLNEEFFVIEEGGKHFVACEWTDTSRQRRVVKRFTFEEFKKRFLGQKIFVRESLRPLAKSWLEWGGRRQYLGGVAFDPSGSTPSDVFNLWRGWPIPPAPGDWTILREHIRDVLCGGDAALFTYLIGWLARMVQRPDQPGEVVPVFRGAQGAGKTVVGTAIMRMFGQHALQVSSPRAVVGQFNAHLRDLVFLLANEAFFAGDRAATSTLKGLITDSTLFIEMKGVDAVEVPNFLHIMMTTNSSWAVPVALEDRRFVVLDVDPARVGDRDYFRQLHAAVATDAVIAAMLHDLLTEDLTDFQVRDIPATRARHEQMIHSLEGEQAWLFHVLALGNLGLGADEWPVFASTTTLQQSHEVWARGGKFRHATDPATLGRFLSRFFRAGRPRQDNPDRLRGYQLGSLEKARDTFCEVTGLPIDVFPDDARGDEAAA